MGWPGSLVLVRHAESGGNVLSVDQRAEYDLATHAYPLTERGREQARITGAYLYDRFGKFDAYYASYYRRSRETMEIMFPLVKIYEDPRLAEAQRGIYHSLSSAKIAELFPSELARKEREGLYHYRPLGGENWPDVELRIHSFLGTLARDYDGRSVVIVVHGHWLILFQRLIEHFSIDEAVHRYHTAIAKNASVTVYSGRSIDRSTGTTHRLELMDRNIVPWEGRC